MAIPNINGEQTVNEEELSKHARKEVVKEKREQESILKQKSKEKKENTRNLIILAVCLLALSVLIYYLSSKVDSNKPYIPYKVHWHASVELLVCGQERDDLKVLGVKEHAGLPALHTHGDGVIHLEPSGPVYKKEDISLGAFFDGVGLKFSSTELLNKKNGDKCGDKEGKVRMFVNEKENNEFRRFNFKEGDKIKIVFD